MTAVDLHQQPTGGRRRIGPLGTTARVVVGLYVVGSVVQGQWTGEFQPAAWALGLIGFPALLLAWQRLRARRNLPPLQATGPAGATITTLIGLALWATPWYAPALGFTSDATLLFLGTSMLLAAIHGYAGCEVLAASNWLLSRDDQLGCILFGPVDNLEKKASQTLEGPTNAPPARSRQGDEGKDVGT